MPTRRSTLDIPVDDAMRALDSRLSSLPHIEVSQAAKERGWATLHRELERHPVRPTAPALLKGTGAKTTVRPGGLQPIPVHHGHSRGWRMALGSAGAVVVILAAVLGIYGAGLFEQRHRRARSPSRRPWSIADRSSTDLDRAGHQHRRHRSSESPSTTEAPDTTETTPVTHRHRDSRPPTHVDQHADHRHHRRSRPSPPPRPPNPRSTTTTGAPRSVSPPTG